MNSKLHSKIERIMKRTNLIAWAPDKDPERIFDLHRGLLIFKCVQENITKSEAALKMTLSRFK